LLAGRRPKIGCRRQSRQDVLELNPSQLTLAVERSGKKYARARQQASSNPRSHASLLIIPQSDLVRAPTIEFS